MRCLRDVISVGFRSLLRKAPAQLGRCAGVFLFSGSSLAPKSANDRLGAVLDDHAVEQGLGGAPVFGRQLPHGFELQLEVVARPSFVRVEDQRVGRLE